jgi:hypothetical protein
MSKAITIEEYLKMTEDGNKYGYLHLQPGEIPCDNCAATGDDLSPNHGDRYGNNYACKKCGGEGKVNWIKNIFDKG